LIERPELCKEIETAVKENLIEKPILNYSAEEEYSEE
jgi:hypothetical protein